MKAPGSAPRAGKNRAVVGHRFAMIIVLSDRLGWFRYSSVASRAAGAALDAFHLPADR